MELKREHERGIVEQMIGYLDSLKGMFSEREVRGIIISGREDAVAATVLQGVSKYENSWFCYQVTFAQLVCAE